jgi:transposase-like protein
MPKAKGPRKTHRYDNEFKVKAVRLSQLPGVQVKDVAGYQIVVQR